MYCRGEYLNVMDYEMFLHTNAANEIASVSLYTFTKLHILYFGNLFIYTFLLIFNAILF